MRRSVIQIFCPSTEIAWHQPSPRRTKSVAAAGSEARASSPAGSPTSTMASMSSWWSTVTLRRTCAIGS